MPANSSRIRVLVVDDSPVARALLVHVLESDPQLVIAGVAEDGHAALEFVRQHRPDVVLMDIHMPRLDGFEATRRIMETNPVPIVICSGTTDPRELAVTFRLLEAGAVACVEKPVGPERADFAERVAHLLEMVRLMSEVKVVRRWPRMAPAAQVTAPGTSGTPSVLRPPIPIRIVGIGASTGGPPVLQMILSGLSRDFPTTITIVQHIAQGFLAGLVEWLAQTTGLPVHIAAHGVQARPGHVYLAPDDFHLGVAGGERLVLSRAQPESGLRPAVSFLFRSLAENYGAQAVGVLLTGMGRDGAAELKLMKDQGATTLAQDRESSVVHGMPGEAIKLGAASYVLPAERIADALAALANRKHREGDSRS